MKTRIGRSLICPILVLAVIPGCQVFQSYRPAPILVRDAETGQPIVGADVHISYPLANSSLMAPSDSTALTGSDGIARLRAKPYDDAGIFVKVSAKGYMNENGYRSITELRALEPAHWFEDVQRRPASFVVELFADPQPIVELVVPSYFRGVVKARLHIQEDMRVPAGQRTFVNTLPISGEVEITGPPLLRHANPLDIRAKTTEGKLLGRPDDAATIGFWWLKSDGQSQYYFVGTRGDFEAARPSLRLNGTKSANSSQGRGQGRHGRRGSSDPGLSTPNP